MRYKKLFQTLTMKKEGAFVPFITLGDPNFSQSINILNTLIESGADALELGIPFSDPIADGPSIQDSFQRALTEKITLNHCFEIMKIIRNKHKEIPIGILTYANLVFKNQTNIFYERCTKNNIDSILIADVPIEESLIFRNAANQHNINQIFICPPNADEKLLKKITAYSQSYIYLVSRFGVTGNEYPFHKPLHNLIQNLQQHNAPPILQGFGIFQPEQVKTALLSGVSGIISGSIIADIIKNNINSEQTLLNKIKHYVKSMKHATRQTHNH